MKRATISTTGTTFFGIAITCTTNQLALAIGEPDFENQFPEEGETNYVWDCETSGGELFTIYDFGMVGDFAADEEVEFRIGGFNKVSCIVAKEELSAKLNLSFSPVDVEQALGRTIR